MELSEETEMKGFIEVKQKGSAENLLISVVEIGSVKIR